MFVHYLIDVWQPWVLGGNKSSLFVLPLLNFLQGVLSGQAVQFLECSLNHFFSVFPVYFFFSVSMSHVLSQSVYIYIYVYGIV